MKRLFILLTFCCLFYPLFSQENVEKPKIKKIPAVEVKTLDGKSVNTATFSNDGKPFIISLWATWCRPCIAELDAIADVFDDWVEETGVKLYAVSIDDAKTASRVIPFVNGRAWEYDVLQDINSDFKRALNVVDIPFLCICNEAGEIVWQHTSYAPGNENEVFEIIKQLLK